MWQYLTKCFCSLIISTKICFCRSCCFMQLSYFLRNVYTGSSRIFLLTVEIVITPFTKSSSLSMTVSMSLSVTMSLSLSMSMSVSLSLSLTHVPVSASAHVPIRVPVRIPVLVIVHVPVTVLVRDPVPVPLRVSIHVRFHDDFRSLINKIPEIIILPKATTLN